MRIKIVVMAAALVGAAPAMAVSWANDEVADRYAAGAILRGDYSEASQRLWTAFDYGDRNPEVLLNLAAVQMSRQDVDDARALYQMVLSQKNVDMRTANGTAWSHDIAHRGLAMLGR
jgi:thioredoxin-like negative regulator of GroEL